MIADLNRLQVFFHVYATRGVTSAARELHVTQSAVSQSLRKLEDELGTQLFVRARGRLAPTAAADALFAIVEPFFGELARGIDALRAAQRELVGTVRMGAPVEIGVHLVPRLFAAFRAVHPQIELELQLGHPLELLPRLQRGELDLALADGFASSAQQPVGFAVDEVLVERLVLVGSRKTVTRRDGRCTLAELLGHRFVAYRAGAPALRSWFRHHFGKTAVALEVCLTVESVQAVVMAIEHHLGLGVVPEHIVAPQLRRGTLRALARKQRPLTNQVSLVRLLDRVPTRRERVFARFVVDWMRAAEPARPARAGA